MVQPAPGRASRVDDSRTIAEPLSNTHGTLRGAGPINEGPQRKSLPPEVLDRFSRAYKSEFSEIAWYDAFVAVVNDVYRASNNGDCDYFLNLNASGKDEPIADVIDSIKARIMGTSVQDKEGLMSRINLVEIAKDLSKHGYQLRSFVGEGAMAEVYNVHNPKLEADNVAKILRPEATQEVIERFELERKIGANLIHPGIVRTIAGFDGRNRRYMIMERVVGTTLADHIYPTKDQAGVPMEQNRALEIAKQICDAIECAHKAKILHRDIKPDNTLVTSEGQDIVVKVIDFGIAKVDGKSAVRNGTQSGTAIGTPEYMSPEQMNGDALTPASDTYSIGITLYEMLAGKCPYEASGGSDWERFASLAVKKAHLPTDLSSLQGISVHPEVSRVVQKSLESDPKKRYQTAREFAADIQNAIDAVRASKPVAGDSIDQKYTLEEKVGTERSASASGEYHAATEIASGDRVTVKLVTLFNIKRLTELGNEVGAMIRTLESNKGPGRDNIARIREFGITSGSTAYIVMEDVGNQDVLTAIKNNRFDRDSSSALKVAHGICMGLDYAHSNRISGSTIRPENVFIDDDNNPKIVDLGLKNLGTRAKASIIRIPSKRNLAYVEANTVGQDADIYAMGVMIYEMFGGNVEEKFEPNFDGLDIPNAIKRVITGCTNSDKSTRFKTIKQVAEAIEVYQNSRELSEKTIIGEFPQTTAPVAKPKSRIKTIVQGVGGALVVGAIAAGAILGAGKFRNREPVHEPPARIVNIAPTPVVPTISQPPPAPVAPQPVLDGGVVRHNITFSADAKHFEVFEMVGGQEVSVCNSENARICIASIEHGTENREFIIRKRNKPDQRVTVVPDTNRAVELVFNPQRPRRHHDESRQERSQI